MIATSLSDIRDVDQIPTDIFKSIFIALLGAKECELHRTVSIRSQITKILFRIIMMRDRNKI